jgi:hypothetical protein
MCGRVLQPYCSVSLRRWQARRELANNLTVLAQSKLCSRPENYLKLQPPNFTRAMTWEE